MAYDNLNIGDKIRVLFDGVQPQNDGTYKDLTKQAFANNELLKQKGVGYDAVYNGEDAFGLLYDIVNSNDGNNVTIKTIGQDGEPKEVSQGFGIGTREHDQVMLAYGYSHKITKIIDIPANDFAVISLRIPSNLVHHAEQRYIESYNGIAEVKVILGLLEGELPAVVEQIPAFNQIAEYNPNVKSIFEYRGVHTSNPITGVINSQNTIDQLHIHAQSGNARQATEESNSSVRGRYYREGLYTLLVENVTSATIEFTYIYDWHEY